MTDDGQRRKGRVSFVASRAEFTPKNVQTRDERVKLVYRIKVALENEDGLFKPGMPATARLRARGGAAVTRAARQRPRLSRRRFGSVRAASEVSFEVRRGEMFGLIGPDGAGKTTTLRMILGLLAPDSGEASTCGLDPVREPAPALLARRLPVAEVLALRRPERRRERGVLRR